MRKQMFNVVLSLFVILLLFSSTFTAFAVSGGEEYPLPRNAALYSELEGQLKAMEAKNPALMNYEIIGRSLEGRDLYLVTISDEQGMKNLDKYKSFMQDAVNQPEKARQALKNNDMRIPAFTGMKPPVQTVC